VRHFHPRAYGAMAGATALTILAAACASSTSSSGQTVQALAPGWQGLNPGTGAPQYGGTLNMVGISDVAVMDYDIGYYRTDFQVLRLTVRQLYSWPAIPGRTLTPAPDLATGMPVVTDNGLKQTVTIRSGVMWNTGPPRPVTAQDVDQARLQPQPVCVRRHGGLRVYDPGPDRLLPRLSGRGGDKRHGDEAVHREPLGVRDRGFG